MALLDFILNLAALALWLNWLSLHSDPLARAPPLRSSAPCARPTLPAPNAGNLVTALAAFLLFRAVIYWQFSPAFHWTPNLSMGIITLFFHVDPAAIYFGHMLLFSLLGFAFTLAIFYFWIILLSVVNSRIPDADPLQKLVRLHFKWFEPWPNLIKLLFPFLLGALCWLALHPLLAWLAIVPKIKLTTQLFRQSAVMGLAAYLAWKYLIVGILLLHLLNSYVYFGNHFFWNFINATARNLLFPIRWLPLRLGKMDFLPVVGIALVFLACEAFTRLPSWLPARFYHLLPFLKRQNRFTPTAQLRPPSFPSPFRFGSSGCPRAAPSVAWQ